MSPITGRLNPRRLPHYRWIVLVGLMMCSWTITWYSFALGIFLPQMSDDLGLSSSQQGWLGASFFLGSFLFMIPLTHYLSHFPPVKLMAGVLVVSTVLLFAAAAMPTYPAQIAVRFLIAVVFVGANPARTLITQARFGPGDYAMANGATSATFGITEPIAFWSTAPLLGLLGGWQGLFVFFGIFSAVWTGLWLLIARDASPGESLAPPEAMHQGTRSPLLVARRREVWWASLAVLGSSLAWSASITFWPTFAQEHYGLTEDQTGLVLGFTSLAIFPFSLLAPILLRWTGRRVPLIAGAMLLQVPAFGLLLLTDNVALLVLIGLGQGIGALAFTLIMTAPFHLRDVSPREVAAATAFIIVVNQGGLAIGPAAVGMIGEVASLGLGLAIFAFMPLISVVGAILLGEPEDQHPGAHGRPVRISGTEVAG